MLEELFGFIKSNAQQDVIDNGAVPNEYNDDVVKEAQNSIVNGLNGANQDQLQELQQAAQNGTLNEDTANVGQMTQHFGGNIAEKFGIDGGTAKGIAASLIPMILSKIMGNKNSGTQAGGLNLDSILGGLFGGGASNAGTTTGTGGGIMDTVSNIGKQFGLDKDNDGDVDFDDLKKMI